MVPGTYEALYLVLAFVVPGFLIHSTKANFLTQRSVAPQLDIVQFLTLSAINYAAWYWLIYLINNSAFFQSSSALSAVGWAWVILIGPILLGLSLGFASQKDWFHKLFRRIGLLPVHPIPTAWEWTFGKMHAPRWILVTMKDGRTVAGLFGDRSFASSDPGERDLYIEQLWDIDENGNWAKGPEEKSVLISGGEIRFVELWKQ